MCIEIIEANRIKKELTHEQPCDSKNEFFLIFISKRNRILVLVYIKQLNYKLIFSGVYVRNISTDILLEFRTISSYWIAISSHFLSILIHLKILDLVKANLCEYIRQTRYLYYCKGKNPSFSGPISIALVFKLTAIFLEICSKSIKNSQILLKYWLF